MRPGSAGSTASRPAIVWPVIAWPAIAGMVVLAAAVLLPSPAGAFWPDDPAPPAGETEASVPEGDAVMLELLVNGVSRGEVVALVQVDGPSAPARPLWLSATDFAALGIDAGPLPQGSRDGVAYVRLAPSPLVAILLDIDALRVTLTFAPELLGRQVIDLSSGVDQPPAPSLPAHAWMDYELGLRADRSRQVLSADLAFNAAFAGWSVRSEHAALADGGTFDVRRWRTFAERDWPRAMVRLSVGDLPASRLPSGRLGEATGIRVARRFDLRPGFSAPPTFAWAGTVDGPSTADIYLDGALLRSVRIAPGAYDLRELTYFSGLHDVRVVLSDAFGGRRDILLPHYFSDLPLRRGLHEFEYTLAAPRGAAAQGVASGTAMFTGYHRYGLTDAVTLGVGLEATRAYRAWSSDGVLVLGRAGTFHAQYARSVANVEGEGRVAGSTSSLDYAFTAGAFTFSAEHWRRSPDFGRMPGGPTPIEGLLPTRRTGLALSLGLPRRQSLSLSLQRSVRDDHASTTGLGFRYSARLFDRIAFGARFSRTFDSGRDANELQLRFQFDLGQGWSGGIDAGRAPDADRLAMAVERGMPAEGGWGIRGSFEQDGPARRVEVMARRDFHAAELALQLRQRDGGSGAGAALGVQLGGAVSLVSGAVRASRPIRDGFALVDTGGLAGVRVYRNNGFAGRTGDDGRLLLPGLAPYIRNQVRLDDRDIPIEVLLDAMSIDVTSRTRIGVDARFRTSRVTSAGGRLRLATADGVAVASAVLRTVIDGRDVTTSTGPDGDFYLDGLAPGEFVLDARNMSLRCRAVLRIDPTAPAFTDLGEVACAPSP